MLPRLYQTCGSDPAKAPEFSGDDDDDGPSTSLPGGVTVQH
jgi:hypothetical protein